MKRKLAGSLILLASLFVVVCHLASVLFLTHHSFSDLISRKFSIEQLGQYGDSFGPLTGIFAIVAAIFAGLAYRTQEKSLDLERKKEEKQRDADAKARFDALFFRAVEVYDRAYERLGRSARMKKRGSSAYKLLAEVRDRSQRGDIHPPESESEYWSDLLKDEKFQPVGRFARTVYAMVLWLDEAAQVKELNRWMALFESRLSGPEHFAIRVLIAEHAPQEIRDAAQRLGLFAKVVSKA